MTGGRGRLSAVDVRPGALRAVALVVQLCVVASYNALHAQCPDGSAPPCRAAPTDPGRKPGVSPNSVAVLYFDNLSRDTADAYVADGLTEELIARLGQIERLRVMSRNAVRRYRGAAAADPAAVGRSLGSTYLVSGSVRRSGARVRVNVELIRAATGDRVWGAQYDRSEADLLAMQEDIAGAVATAVTGRLLPPERTSIALRPTDNSDAYRYFLRGNYFLAQRSPRALQRAIAEYGAAIRTDSAFTAALARQAAAFEQLYGRLANPPDTLLLLGLSAAQHALRQDSTSSDAWMAVSQLLQWRHPQDFSAVLRASERAVKLDPRNAEAHHILGIRLAELGEDSAASVAFNKALEVDPLRAISHVQLAVVSEVRRRFGEAERMLDSALAVDPGFAIAHAFRAHLYVRAGRAAEARADAEAALQLSGTDDQQLRWQGEAALVLADLAGGDTSSARARARRLAAGAVERLPVIVAGGPAIGLAGVGDIEPAVAHLERLIRIPKLWRQLRRPAFDPLRSHPRFQRLVEESRPPAAPR